jgi:hypothetical protein
MPGIPGDCMACVSPAYDMQGFGVGLPTLAETSGVRYRVKCASGGKLSSLSLHAPGRNWERYNNLRRLC